MPALFFEDVEKIILKFSGKAKQIGQLKFSERRPQKEESVYQFQDLLYSDHNQDCVLLVVG